MNPALSATSEPIASLPLGSVAFGLLLLVVLLVLVGWLIARRRSSTPSEVSATPGPNDVDWLRPLLEGLTQPALVADAGDTPIAWNTGAERTLGLGDRATELPLSLVALVGRVQNSGTPETTDIAVPDAPHRRVRATAASLGQEMGTLVLLQNPAQGTRSAESYRGLISAVAHELRTPLTAILGHADILGSCDPVEDEALWRRSRDFVAREAQRLARLVEDLSTLSRLDRSPLQQRPINLRAVAEEAISALYQKAEVRGVALSLHSPSDVPRVLGDRDRLGQVLINLLDNAIKYSPRGGQASVHLTPEEEFVTVDVRDTGVGIPAEELPFIFDSLFRGEGVRESPGTGLGLTIVRTILDQHGAKIDASSTRGQGTAFRFGLPRAQRNAHKR